ncbi:MAG: alpha/beta hydrolase [Rikenellaceae bacterium]|nr:alpha/beta hydrolase [Rikenellaceae bacterium]
MPVQQSLRPFRFLFLLLCIGKVSASAQNPITDLPEFIDKQTVVYALKQTDTLRMDIYRQRETRGRQPVVLFQSGGSFMTGSRDRETFRNYFVALIENGFTVVSIDYRLGMKGKKYNFHTLTSKQDGLASAVQQAVEDLFSATDYLIRHADRWQIDPDSMLASGSSAGAISALQADWILKNRYPGSEILPQGFTYRGGVIAFAGGIFSRRGGPTWKQRAPAPTLMFHGTKDRIVPYRTIRLFRIGMFTSNNLHRRMRRAGGDYLLVRLQGKDHLYGAGYAMSEGLPFTEWFLRECILKDEGRQLVFDIGKEF